MNFEQEIINRLYQSSYLVSGLSMFHDKPAIFAYFMPEEFQISFSYVVFDIENYNVPTKGDTKLLKVMIVNDDIDEIEFRRYAIEIINCLDNAIIDDDEKGQLRIYLSSNPIYKPYEYLMVSHGIITFIIRGNLDSWNLS